MNVDNSKNLHPPPYDSIPSQSPAVTPRDSNEYSYTTVQCHRQQPLAYLDADGATQAYEGPDIVANTRDESTNYCTPIHSDIDNHLYRVILTEQHRKDEYEVTEVYIECITVLKDL